MKKLIIPLAAALSFPAYAAKAQAVVVKRSVCRTVVVAPRPVVRVRPVVVRPMPVVVFPPARVVVRRTVIYK